MKRLHLFIVMCLLSLTSGLQAQEQAEAGEQLLVFRNTGVVDLLYTNEVDSILTNDSTQVFYAKDTVLVVPIAELDSVAVGNRNVREMKSEVHELTNERDLPWLIRVEGNHLYYRLETPQNFLPKAGEKLFYGDRHELLPTGLAVRVTSVTKGTEIDVEVEDVELHEIFDRLFFSGRLSTNSNGKENSSRRAPWDPVTDYIRAHTIPMDNELEIGTIGKFETKGSTEINGDFVVDVFKHYYHAHIRIDTEIGFEYQLRTDDSGEMHVNSPRVYIPLPVIAGVLHPSIYLNLFADLKAEARFDFSMKRKYHYEYDWTRQNGEQHGKMIEPVDGDNNTNDEAKAQLILNGEIFLGAQMGTSLALTGDRVGFRFDVKAGPCLEGKLGLGILSQMRNYQPEYYHEANVELSVKLALQTSLFHHEILWLFGDEVENPLYGHDFYLAKRTWNLFPQYQHTNATASARSTSQLEEMQEVVSMATAVDEYVPADLDTGFEIVDELGEVVDSVFVGTITAKPEDTTVAQTFDAEITLPSNIKQENLEGYTMRPIFHYAGYTISAAPVEIRKDVLLQSYSATQTNGAMTFIGNSPFLGSVVKDSTLYQVGLYLPVPLKNNVYQQGKDRRIITGTPIDSYRSGLLIGTWTGKVNGENVTLIFNEGKTGEFNKVGFVYELNNPQSGDLVLKFGDGEPMILRLLSVSEVELKLRDKRDKEQTVWTLTR